MIGFFICLFSLKEDAERGSNINNLTLAHHPVCLTLLRQGRSSPVNIAGLKGRKKGQVNIVCVCVI